MVRESGESTRYSLEAAIGRPWDLSSKPTISELDGFLWMRTSWLWFTTDQEKFELFRDRVKLKQVGTKLYIWVPRYYAQAWMKPKDYFKMTTDGDYLKVASVDTINQFFPLFADIAVSIADPTMREEMINVLDGQLLTLWYKSVDGISPVRKEIETREKNAEKAIEDTLDATKETADATTWEMEETIEVETETRDELETIVTDTSTVTSTATATSTTSAHSWVTSTTHGSSTTSTGSKRPPTLTVDVEDPEAQTQAAKKTTQEHKKYEKDLNKANKETVKAKKKELRTLAELTESAVLAHLDARIAILTSRLTGLIQAYNTIITNKNNGEPYSDGDMQQLNTLRNDLIWTVAHIKLLLDETKLPWLFNKREKFDRDLCSILTGLWGSFGRRRWRRNSYKSAYKSAEFKAAYKAAKKWMVLWSTYTSYKDKAKAQAWLDKNTSPMWSRASEYTPSGRRLSKKERKKKRNIEMWWSQEALAQETVQKVVWKTSTEKSIDYMKYPIDRLLSQFNAIDEAWGTENAEAIRMATAKRILLEMTEQTNESDQSGWNNKPYFFSLVDKIWWYEAFRDLLGGHILTKSDRDRINSEYSNNANLLTGKNAAWQTVEVWDDVAWLTGVAQDKLLVELFTRRLSHRTWVPYAPINRMYSAEEEDGNVIDASVVAQRISSIYQWNTSLWDASLMNRHSTAWTLIANGLNRAWLDAETSTKVWQKINSVLSGASDILKAWAVISGIFTWWRMLYRLFIWKYKWRWNEIWKIFKEELRVGTFAPAKLLFLQWATKLWWKGAAKAREDSWANKLVNKFSKEDREKSRKKERVSQWLWIESESHASEIGRTIWAMPIHTLLSQGFLKVWNNDGIILNGDVFYKAFPKEKEWLNVSGQKQLLNRLAQAFVDRYALTFSQLQALSKKSWTLQEVLDRREIQKNKIESASWPLIRAGLRSATDTTKLLDASPAEIEKVRKRLAFASIQSIKTDSNGNTRSTLIQQMMPNNSTTIGSTSTDLSRSIWDALWFEVSWQTLWQHMHDALAAYIKWTNDETAYFTWLNRALAIADAWNSAKSDYIALWNTGNPMLTYFAASDIWNGYPGKPEIEDYSSYTWLWTIAANPTGWVPAAHATLPGAGALSWYATPLTAVPPTFTWY